MGKLILPRTPGLVMDRDHNPVGLITGHDARRFMGRARARDVAFQFRMTAGIPGDVNRRHPATIEPTNPDATNPPTVTGQAVLVNTTTQSVRKVLTSDSAIDAIYGITVRPYPFQDSGSGEVYGAATLGTAPSLVTGAEVDVLRSGYILVLVSGGVTNVAKGVRVWIWVAAASGGAQPVGHVTGGFEAQTSGSVIELDEKTYWNGTPDANGVAEIGFNI